MKVILQMFIGYLDEKFGFKELVTKIPRQFEVNRGCLKLQGPLKSSYATHVLSVVLSIEEGSHICPRVSLLTL